MHPLQLSEREARFVGDVLKGRYVHPACVPVRLCSRLRFARSRNTTLKSVDGFSVEETEFLSFHAKPVQYHHLVLIGLQLSVTSHIKRLE